MISYFLVAILALGIITSYDDIKIGKIKNKYIILAIAYSLVVYIVLILNYYFSGTMISHTYLIHLATNFLFAIIVGFLAWWIGIWTTGDGKLFIAYSVLVPLTAYSNSYIPYFPSTVLLINAFLPFLFYSVVKLLFSTTAKEKIKALKEFNLKNIIGLMISLFALSWLSQIIFSFLKIPLSFFFNIFLIFILMFSIKKLLPVGFTAVSIILSGLRIIFDYNYIITSEFLKGFSLLFFVFLFLRYFILGLGFAVFTKQIKTSKLKPRMVLAEGIYKEKGKFKKKKLSYLNFYPEEKKIKFIIENLPEGLSESNIKKIRKLKLGFKDIRIQQTLPFAPFMFLGVLLTLLAKGNILILIKTILINFF